MEGKGKIKAAALRLFVEKGLSVSTNSITREAGVATGLMYHHFSSKEELIVELYSDCFSEMIERTKRLFEGPSDSISFESYFNLSEKSFWADVTWGLSNWQKFQFIALVDGSLLLEQLSLSGVEAAREWERVFLEFHDVGVRNGYIANLPADYAINVSKSIVRAATELFHDSPQMLEDEALKREIRLRHWLAAGGLSPRA